MKTLRKSLIDCKGVFLRYREKSVWLTVFLNLERDEKSTFLGRKFQTLITLYWRIWPRHSTCSYIPRASMRLLVRCSTTDDPSLDRWRPASSVRADRLTACSVLASL